MASAADLFQRKTFEDKRPKPPAFNAPGDFHDILLTAEPVREQQKQVGGNWEPVFLEKQTDGKWKPKSTSELTEGRDNFPLMQVVVQGKLMGTGEDTVFYFDNKTKLDALEAAMEKTDLTVGNAVRITRLPNKGKAYDWDVKIAAPKDK